MKEMGLRSNPAPFLTKTYMMVDDESTNEVISWGEGGTTFVVWKTAEFAKDLLPTYFKHNNFSSFVRQLNTYGFRKIVPDKWEFANDNFKRGEKGLLAEIRRRKASAPAPAPEVPTGKVSGRNPSQASSGDEAGSSSTSSPESKNPGSLSVERADLSGENEKLRRENEILSEELAQARKHCDELMTFLTGYLKVGPDQINQIMRQEMVVGDDDDDDDDDDEKDKENSRKNKKMEEGSLKLFGVWLNQGKKRGRCCESDNTMGLSGAQHGRKVMKTR